MATEAQKIVPELRAARDFETLAEAARTYGKACRYEGRSAMVYVKSAGADAKEADARWMDAQRDVTRAWNLFLEAAHQACEPWREPARRRP